MKHLNNQLTATPSIMIFSIGLMLSCNVFAAAGAKATQVALDAAITDLQDQLTELGSPRTYEIGDRGPAGGLVFYVDKFGQHGLEAAPSDQGENISWTRVIDLDFGHDTVLTYTEARGDGIGAGAMNTMLIIANLGHDSNSYAAGLCANLVIHNDGVDYGDWYLPSIEESYLMYANLQAAGLGNLANDCYWSSTEVSDQTARVQCFTEGGHQFIWAKYLLLWVRAVRAF